MNKRERESERENAQFSNDMSECKLDKPLNPSIQIKTFRLLNCATNNWYESSFIFMNWI